MKFSLGDMAPVDLDRLVETRLLIQANSGGGKSWAIRRLLEQTHGCVQQIVLDVEGEFHTLREKFDYVLARPHDGDCVAHPKTAALLAEKALELGVSLIADIYELKAHERLAFARSFLTALVNAPKRLWHPALIIIDEAHVFCPQTTGAESGGAVIDLMTRGRKRGFCGVLATQRLSKLHKDAAAEANNKLIGRTGLDVDMKRAAEELGITKREDMLALRTLAPGAFFAFGPALSLEVKHIQVGPVSTTHPKPGQRQAPTPPPSEKVKAALAKLSELPKEAEEEARTNEALRRDLAEARRKLTMAERGAPQIDPAAVEAAREDAYRLGVQAGKIAMGQRTQAAFEGALRQAAAHFDGELKKVSVEIVAAAKPLRPAPVKTVQRYSNPIPTRRRSATNGHGEKLRGAEMRILRVLASIHPARATMAQWATLAVMKRTGGTWSTYLSRLRVAGYLDEMGDTVGVTAEGMDAAGEIPPAPETPGEIQAMWKDKVGSGAARLLDILIERYPHSVNRAELAELANLAANAGTFSTYLSRLTSNRIAERNRDGIRASEALFG